MTRIPFAVALTLAASQAAAQEVQPCDPLWFPDAVAEPWEENTQSFANGDVRLVLLDRVEPAAGGYFLAILSPPRDELGFRSCQAIGTAPGIGYSALTLDGLESSYDPARGLTFALRAETYRPEDGTGLPVRLVVTANQSTGEITARQEPRSE